jgi:chromosome segregation ATPase
MSRLVTEVLARSLRNAWERIDALRDELAQTRRAVADAEESAQSSDAAYADLSRDYAQLKDELAEARRQLAELERARNEDAYRSSRIERGVRALVDYAFKRAASAEADGDDDVYRAYDDMQLRLEEVLSLDDYSNPSAPREPLAERVDEALSVVNGEEGA